MGRTQPFGPHFHLRGVIKGEIKITLIPLITLKLT